MNLPEPIPDPATLLDRLRERTPARVLAGRAGASYRTSTQLSLRLDHAAARDAVHAVVDPLRDLGGELLTSYAIFDVRTKARTKSEYLMRPDLGRHLDEESGRLLLERCPRRPDLQVVVGDGLSASAVVAQVPILLPLLIAGALRRKLRVGRTFFVHHCRVGVLNDVGDLLDPEVVVLLIGERPGLATAESLSAYMAYRPCSGRTDADRNLISNIHARGVGCAEASSRILALADTMLALKKSGTEVKEER